MAQAHAIASPSGESVIFVRDLALGVHNLNTNQTRFGDIEPRYQQSKVTSLRSSSDRALVLIVSDAGVKVMNVDDNIEAIADLDNGSGGLGRIISAEFVAKNSVLTVWEFGRAKLWDVTTGTSVDLPEIKTEYDGQTKQLRPQTGEHSDSPALLAILSRNGADDHLILYLVDSQQVPTDIKLSTLDARCLHWSPDGRWLVIVDVLTTSPNLLIFTPDGHLFRSYSSVADTDGVLGVKAVEWSPDGLFLALAKHDGRIELLNTRTFTLVAAVQHTTTIDHRSLTAANRAIIWQESVSASNARSYISSPHPMSPPLSKPKGSVGEPNELGIIECCFNCDGSYLASRDARMSNTVWLWNMSRLSTHAIIIQHSSIRRLIWHPTRRDLLMIDCAEGLAHLYHVSSTKPPFAIVTEAKPKASLSWIPNGPEEKCIILAIEKLRYHLVFPEGRHTTTGPGHEKANDSNAINFQDDDILEDSLLDVLSGRKPLPPKTQPSYSELAGMEPNAVGDIGGDDLDDTFREKRKTVEVKQLEFDPLDDSDIF